MFLASDSSIQHALEAAASCDCAISKVKWDSALSMRVKVAISTGDLVLAHLGTVDRCEFLVAGKPISDMALCLPLAEPGSVVCGMDCASALVGCGFDCTPLEKTTYYRVNGQSKTPQSLPLPSANTVSTTNVGSVLRAYLPWSVQQRISASHMLADIRTVTVLFLSPESVDTTNAGCVDALQRTMEVTVHALRRFCGDLRQCLVDDKGPVLICCFGLPGMSQENDSERCVLCAVDISKRLRGAQIECAMGVATGRVFCGTIGDASRCEYAVIGTHTV